METQTTILNVVTSEKNQEIAQEKIQKMNVSQLQQQQNMQKQHIQQHFLRERNTCQDQPQFEHEIFQLNVRQQNSKESNPQKKLKTLFVGSLNKNTYLKDKCCLKVVLSKSSIVFAFITAPDHLCPELILNRLPCMEEALVEPKRTASHHPQIKRKLQLKTTRHVLKKLV